MIDTPEQFDHALDDEAFIKLVLRHLDDCTTPEETQTLWLMLERDDEKLQLFTALSIQACEVMEIVKPQHDVAEELAADDTDAMGLLAEVLAIEERAMRRKAMAQIERDKAEHERSSMPTVDRYQFDPTPVRHIVIPRTIAYGTLAAVAAMLLMFAYVVFRPTAPVTSSSTIAEIPTPPPTIAHLSSGVNMIWASSSGQPTIGDVLDHQNLELLHGVAELTFADGSVVLIEAPAQFYVNGEKRLDLRFGRLTGNIPPAGVGFAVHTPSAVVVDHGTEFGVYVDVAQPQTTDIHVFTGAVAVSPDATGSSQAMLLTAGQARRATAGVIMPLTDDGRAYLRRMPSPYELAVRRSTPLAYWRLGDASPDGRIVDHGSARADATLPLGSQFVVPGAVGDRNAAVAFEGMHDGMKIDKLAGFGESGPYSVEAWVKPPADLRGNCRIVSTRGTAGGFAVGIAGSDNSADARAMTVMLNVYNVQDFSTTLPVQANVWTHVVVTVDDEGEPRVYLNGELSPMLVRDARRGGLRRAYFPFEEVKADVRKAFARPSDGTLYLATNPPPANAAENVIDKEFGAFQGQLDEVALYVRALSAAEVREHYRAATRVDGK